MTHVQPGWNALAELTNENPPGCRPSMERALLPMDRFGREVQEGAAFRPGGKLRQQAWLHARKWRSSGGSAVVKDWHKMVRAWRGFRVGQERDECGSFIAPTSSQFTSARHAHLSLDKHVFYMDAPRRRSDDVSNSIECPRYRKSGKWKAMRQQNMFDRFASILRSS